MSKNRFKNNLEELDVEMALNLHQKYNPLGLTENAVFPEHIKNDGNYRPRTLVDQTLEVVDPTPNIYTLFSQFDARFFFNKLVSVEVKWSQRMTSCAGICSFHPRSRDCVISLSAPLLKLRPRKDLVETLLHEMIHGYLFLTSNNRDRDGHGPEFQKIMHRINKEAGTNITIYHSFHDEVRLYQQHWWRCNGPCQKRPPYFGTVRRAMNRAPGPSDFWWSRHQETCNGTFTKVREPEKKKKKPSRSKKNSGVNENKNPTEKTSGSKPRKNLDDWLGKMVGKPIVPETPKSTKVPPMNPFTPTDYRRTTGKSPVSDFVKLGTNTNNVHGWGTAGPGNSSSKSSGPSRNVSSNGNPGKTLNFVGTLGGSDTGRSNLLNKYSSPIGPSRETKDRIPSAIPIESSPPSKKPRIIGPSNNVRSIPLLDEMVIPGLFDCPNCKFPFSLERLNDHLDSCLDNESEQTTNEGRSSVIEILDSPENRSEERDDGKFVRPASNPLEGRTNLNDFVGTTKHDLGKGISCPICEKTFEIDKFNDHLDNCPPTETIQLPINIGRGGNVDSRSRKSSKNSEATKAPTNPNEAYVCLVCNARVSGNIELSDHLEECVERIFNDDTFHVGNATILENSPPKINGANDQFPCPICMEFVPEIFMNEHLDSCLLRNNKTN